MEEKTESATLDNGVKILFGRKELGSYSFLFDACVLYQQGCFLQISVGSPFFPWHCSACCRHLLDLQGRGECEAYRFHYCIDNGGFRYACPF